MGFICEKITDDEVSKSTDTAEDNFEDFNFIQENLFSSAYQKSLDNFGEMIGLAFNPEAKSFDLEQNLDSELNDFNLFHFNKSNRFFINKSRNNLISDINQNRLIYIDFDYPVSFVSFLLFSIEQKLEDSLLFEVSNENLRLNFKIDFICEYSEVVHLLNIKIDSHNFEIEGLIEEIGFQLKDIDLDNPIRKIIIQINQEQNNNKMIFLNESSGGDLEINNENIFFNDRNYSLMIENNENDLNFCENDSFQLSNDESDNNFDLSLKNENSFIHWMNSLKICFLEDPIENKLSEFEEIELLNERCIDFFDLEESRGKIFYFIKIDHQNIRFLYKDLLSNDFYYFAYASGIK